MSLNFHGTDEQLELYARGKLPAAQVTELEEHLLVCATCLEQVETNEQWVLAVREALETNSRMERRPSWLGFRWVQVGFAAAAIVVIGLLVLSKGGPMVPPVAYVQLAAVRGEMISVVNRAKEFDLTLLDAPSGGNFRVQVVDSGGASKWEGTAPRTAKGVEVQVKKALPAGNYFVRLYAPNGRMLHEYGLRVL